VRHLKTKQEHIEFIFLATPNVRLPGTVGVERITSNAAYNLLANERKGEHRMLTLWMYDFYYKEDRKQTVVCLTVHTIT